MTELYEIKDNPSLGIWKIIAGTRSSDWCRIAPHRNVPAGLAHLATVGKIEVRRDTLSVYRPQQTERLF